MSLVGDPLILDLTLFDFVDDKFVRATIDADGVPLAVSPVTVPNVGNGRHFLFDAINVVFPENRLETIITYEVFNDALFTERSKKHAPAKDKYLLSQAPEQTNPDLLARLDRIISLISELKVLDGVIEEDEIDGTIEIPEVEGSIDDSIELQGDVVPDNEISGLINDPELEGLF